MASSNSSSLLLIIFPLAATTVFLISLPHSCSADTNTFSGSLCDNPPANQTSPWMLNLNTVFTSLAANLNRTNALVYRAEAGKAPNRAFALIQCRGDLPPTNCVECAQESFRLATNYCGGSTTNVVWQKWCLLRYANASFYGTWEGSGVLVPSGKATSVADPAAAIKGLNMMSELAADAPNERLMFARSTTDDRKRYGLVQCNGDLRKKDCRDCLDHFLKNFGPIVNDSTPWGIYGVGCFMMYDYHQFYFNSSKTLEENSSDTGKISSGWIVVATTIFTTAMAYL